MKCLILAAGYATRLYPLTENFPKPLLKVGEKSILDWLVDDLVDTTDIDEFVVISNHKFAQHFVNWKNEKVKTRPYEITVIYTVRQRATSSLLRHTACNGAFSITSLNCSTVMFALAAAFSIDSELSRTNSISVSILSS